MISWFDIINWLFDVIRITIGDELICCSKDIHILCIDYEKLKKKVVPLFQGIYEDAVVYCGILA
jgi:hypothetical protein